MIYKATLSDVDDIINMARKAFNHKADAAAYYKDIVSIIEKDKSVIRINGVLDIK